MTGQKMEKLVRVDDKIVVLPEQKRRNSEFLQLPTLGEAPIAPSTVRFPAAAAFTCDYIPGSEEEYRMSVRTLTFSIERCS